MLNSLLLKIKEKYHKAIVTGGAGFIGSHICEELVKSGLHVISIDNYQAGKRQNHAHLDSFSNFEAVDCDITNMNILPKHFKDVDIIFHNAAAKKTVCLKDPRRDLEVNGLGTYNMLELSHAFGVKKFIHASTGSVYGEPVLFPQTEDHPLNPCSYYGVSKLAGERYAILFNKVTNLDVTVLRYFHVFGTRQESNEFGGVVSIFIRNMLKNQQPVIFGDGTQERSFTFVKDVVAANLLVAVKNETKGQVYNCASGISVTINQLLDAVIKAFDRDGKISPIYRDWTIGDIKKFNVSSDKIQKIGMSFDKDFFQRLTETIHDMRNRGIY